MKPLIIILAISLTACATPYARVGIGYKIQDVDVHDLANDPVTARIEAGFERGNLTYGISHHSQYFTGWPFNDDKEYLKTEFFIDYKFTLEHLK